MYGHSTHVIPTSPSSLSSFSHVPYFKIHNLAGYYCHSDGIYNLISPSIFACMFRADHLVPNEGVDNGEN